MKNNQITYEIFYGQRAMEQLEYTLIAAIKRRDKAVGDDKRMARKAVVTIEKSISNLEKSLNYFHN